MTLPSETERRSATVAVTVPRRRRRARVDDDAGRTLISPTDRRRPLVRWSLTPLQWLLLLAVTAISLLPILWLFKSAISPTQEIIRDPFALWPSDPEWENFGRAWNELSVGKYMWNTVILAGGAVLFQVGVSATLAFGISVMRPRYAKIVYGAVLATLLLPPTVSLIALYLTILDMPLIGINLQNTVWAFWLPAAVHGFSVLLLVRFFDSIPRELFDAAQIDGAGPFTIFWRVVLPMSRPILAVVSLLAFMSSWKEFLWPLIALPDPDLQPISVALQRISIFVQQNLLFAALFVAALPPLIVFIIFQKQIVKGAGFTGVKG